MHMHTGNSELCKVEIKRDIFQGDSSWHHWSS